MVYPQQNKVIISDNYKQLFLFWEHIIWPVDQN